jgi:hypothetical protein
MANRAITKSTEVGSSKTGILLILLSLAIVALVLWFLGEKRNEPKLSDTSSIKISIQEVKNQLSNFIIENFDKQNVKLSDKWVSGVTCKPNMGCEPDRLILRTPRAFGPTSWMVNFYSSYIGASNSSEENINALNRALYYTQEYINSTANLYSSQAYVFLDAFLKTQRIEFLRAFVISTQSLVKDSIEGYVFSKPLLRQAHPMDTARYSQQVVLVSKLLNSGFESGEIPNIDFSNPSYLYQNEHSSRYQWVMNSRELLKSQSAEVAQKFMTNAEIASKADFFQKLSKVDEDGWTDAVCWVAFGYAAVFDATRDLVFKEKSVSLLRESGLEEGDFSNKNIILLQSLLPCVNSYKILAKSEPAYAEVFRESLKQVISRFWDAKKNSICSASGGFVKQSQPDLKIEPLAQRKMCEGQTFTIADNAWMYSTISDIEDFDWGVKN